MAMDTAVMEQILSNMLKLQQQQSKEQAVAFARLAKAAGLDPKIIATAESKLKNLGDAAEETAKSTGKMNKAGNIAGAALADLASGVMSTAGNLINFGTSAMMGSAKVSDFFAAFKDLPIIGSVAGLFSSLMKVQEAALESFSSLSQNGLDLGSSLTKLRFDALSMGLTLEEMTKVLKDNSETLVQMGGSASVGARNFREISKAMGSSGLRQELLNLGFTFEETNQLVGQYARSVGGLTKDQLKDYRSVAVAAAAYGKELDFLARLTGESREATQKKLEEEAMEANWQAFLAGKDEETRKKLTDGLQKSLAGAGKAGADIFKAAAQGVAVQGEAGQLTTSLMGEMSETIRKAALDANNSSISSQKFLSNSTRFLATVQSQSAKGYKDNDRVFQALALSGDPLAAQMGVHATNYKTLGNAQGNLSMSIEENVKRLEKERRDAEEKAKKADAEAAAMRQMQEAIKNLGMQLWSAFSPLFPIMTDFVMKSGPLIRQFAETLGTAIRWFSEKVVSEQGRQEILNKIAEFLKDLFGKIFDMVKPSAASGTNVGISVAGGAAMGAGLGSVVPGIGTAFGAVTGALAGLTVALGEWAWEAMSKSGGRSKGSWGTVGSAFENFGSGTPITLHGTEGVFTPDQINKLMATGTSNALEGLVSQLNNSQAEMNRTLREIADYGRRNVDATNSLSGNAFA
jgi:hypothetical protein